MAKILIILRLLWTAGAQRIAINEYKWLKKLGYEPKIIFLRGTKMKGYEELLKDVDYKVIRYGYGPLTPLFYIPTKIFAPDRGMESTVDLDLIMRISEIAKQEKADYIIAHDQFTAIGCYLAYKRFKIPYSVFVHEKLVKYGKSILSKMLDKLEYKVLSNASRVLAVTEKVAKTIYEKHRIKAVPNYPGMDKVSERSYSQKENILLSVSFWDLGRRPWDYLEIAKRVEGYKLLLVGNWRVKKAKEYVMKKIRDEKLEEKIELKEGISEAELRELYSKAKFTVRFGFEEYGPAMTVIESLQHTTPVIINDELGTAELVSKYNLGFVSHGLDFDSIANFINSVDEEKYKELQENIKKVQKEYTWENHVKKIVEDII